MMSYHLQANFTREGPLFVIFTLKIDLMFGTTAQNYSSGIISTIVFIS